MIKYFRAVNYRSIRDLWLNVQPINVIVGPNGAGKTNLYKSLYLLSCAARGRLAESIATEGGFNSALWSGRFDKSTFEKLPKIRLSANVDSFEHQLWIGRAPGPVGSTTMRPSVFANDPVIRREDIYHFKNGVKSQLLKRRLMFVSARDLKGKLSEYNEKVMDMESVLAGLRDPLQFPYLFSLREKMADWRFYHKFRTDRHSSIRRPQLGAMTPRLSDDGLDLAAALATIQSYEMDGDVGPEDSLITAIEAAFPGAELFFSGNTFNQLELKLKLPALNRPLNASELSDGTLKYLCLCAALLSHYPASLLAFNEPEQSLHPNLLEPLSRLFVSASKKSQIWITTHSQELADYILEYSGYAPIELEKVKGETKLVGVGLGGYREPPDDDDEGQQEG